MEENKKFTLFKWDVNVKKIHWQKNEFSQSGIDRQVAAWHSYLVIRLAQNMVKPFGGAF